MLDFDGLVQKAKSGDAAALQQLRACGYFEALKAEKEGVPLIFSQRGLWALHNIDAGGTGAYNITGAYRLKGALRADLLGQAGALLVARHEALRSRFGLHENQPRQFIQLKAEFKLEEQDSSHLASDPAALRETVRQAAAAPFNLEQAPLFRMHLFKLSENDRIMLLAMHHIIGDGWSVGLLAKELGLIYASLLSGKEPELPAPGSWRTYAQAQSAAMQADGFGAVKEYWRNLYAALPEPLHIPSDRSRPAAQSYRGACLAVAVPAAASVAIAKLCQISQASLFTVVESSIRALMHRYTGQDDLISTFPLAGRDRPEDEHAAGMFMRTLPLRYQTQGKETFGDWLKAGREALFNAFDNQPYSLDMLMEGLGAGLNQASSPFSRLMVVLQEKGQTALALPGIAAEEYDNAHYPALFDLVFEFSPGEPAGLRIHYSTELFDEGRIQRMAAHLFNLIRAAAANPAQPCASLPLLDSDEREQVVNAFNNAVREDFGAEASFTLHRLFSTWTEKTPASPAVTFQGKTLSYREFEAASNRVANLLLAQPGWQAESRVAVLLDRSEQLPVMMAGIMRAGGCYVPIDPSYPPDRVQFMLEDAECAAVVADQLGRALLPEKPHCQVFSPEDFASAPETAVAEKSSSEKLAYMIYTSGSTGKPKGVMVEHRGAVNLSLGLRSAFSIKNPDVVLQFASCSFDASIFDMVMALASGACLCMIPRALLTDGDAFAAHLAEKRVTMATLNPSFVDALPEGALDPLRFLMTAGEAARPATARRLRNKLRFTNGYGPTETSVCASWHEVSPAEEIGEQIPIGHPMCNHRVYVLDPSGQPCPIGVAGEICVGGAGVGRGYFHRPELTAEKFVPDPFAGNGARMYRTGDTGYWLPNGAVMFLGRIDDQIKIRGFRVELGEVERSLEQAQGVESAAVVLCHDQATGAKSLAACYVAQQELDALELRKALAHALPEYMLPTVYLRVAEWPKSPSGKIDRKKLAELCAKQAVQIASQEAASGEAEQLTAGEAAVAEVWRKLLSVATVRKGDNFFQIGGDSIRAIQVVHALKEKGFSATAANLFKNPTAAAFAATIATGGAGQAGAVADQPGEVAPSPMQAWFVESQRGRKAIDWFNQATLLKLKRKVKPAELRAALAAVLRQHAALRLKLNQNSKLEILPFADGQVELREASLPAGAPSSALAQLADEEHLALRLAEGKVFRALLATEGEAQRLLLTAHHIGVDFVAWRVICEDLGAALDCVAAGKPASLPLPSTGWRQWTEALAQERGRHLGELPFWRKQLEGAPAQLAVMANAVQDVSEESCDLPAALVATLRQDGCAAYKCEWPELLLSILAGAAAKALGLEKISIMQEGHGREAFAAAPSPDRAVGWFTSVYPVLVELGDGSPAAIAKNARENLRALPHKGASFNLLRHLPGEGAAELASLPLPGIIFNYAGEAGGENGNGWFSLEEETPGQAISPDRSLAHPVEMTASLAADGSLQAKMFAPAQLRAQLASLAAAFKREAQAFASACGASEAVAALDYDGFASDTDLDSFLKGL